MLLATAVLVSVLSSTAVAPEPPRARVVAAARRLLGRPFRGDCSAFVRRVYADAGVPLRPAARARSGTEAIVRGLPRTRRPRPGDVAWFHGTHDRDPPGAGRNLFTHVGVVESVSGSRVSLIHRSNTGVRRLRMDLARPGDPAANDALRRRRPGDAAARRVLAGELLSGFASPFPAGVAARAAGAASTRHRPGEQPPRRDATEGRRKRFDAPAVLP